MAAIQQAASSIRFGVPSLDNLFTSVSVSQRSPGVTIEEGEDTRLSLIGPEGSGKSVLALHLASRFAADVYSRARTGGIREQPKVIYISTDLTTSKARTMWSAFRLDRPNLREVPFYRTTLEREGEQPVGASEVGLKVDLKPLDPIADNSENSLAEFILHGRPAQEEAVVGLIDLIRHPVGDIWSFTSRLIASLERSTGPEDQHRIAKDKRRIAKDKHLIVIDDVDGFEAIAGEVNAFGDKSTVRARIIQAIQAASRKAHLVFLSTEQGPGSRILADLSDVVVRLRFETTDDYKSRLIEIQKARAQATRRGNHTFLIRMGEGSTTDDHENPDEPRTTNAYVQVVPSLNTISRRSMNEPGSWDPARGLIKSRAAGFGLPHLDELCGSAPSKAADLFDHDVHGLPYGTLTAILGDPNTYKTPLGLKFLCRGFELFALNLIRLYKDWCAEGTFAASQKCKEALHQVKAAKALRRKVSSDDGQPIESQQAAPPKLTLEKLEGADADTVIRHLSRILFRARRAAEEGLTFDEIHKEIESVVENKSMSHRLMWWCACLSARLLTNRLRSLLDDTSGHSKAESLAAIALPGYEGLARNLFERLLRKPIVGSDLLAAVEEQWWRERGRFIEHPPNSRSRQRIRRSFVDDRTIPRVDLVREVIRECNGGISLDTDKKSFRQAVKEEWEARSAEACLREFLPGSTNYLTTDQIRQLKQSPISAFEECDFDLCNRIFVGLAVCAVESEIEEGRRRKDNLKAWLKRIPGFAEVLNGTAVTARGLANAILCGFDDATNVDQRLLEYEAAGVVPKASGRIRLSGATNEVLPQLVFGATFHATAMTPTKFAKWLFALSPRTHPYASKHGVKALADEIILLSNRAVKRKKASPVFCSTTVAAVLHLVRLGKLKLKGHQADELRARHEGCEEVGKLCAWLEKNVGPGGETADAAHRSLMDLAERAKDGRLSQKDLAAVVESVSRLRGFWFDIGWLESSNTPSAEKLQFCRLLLEEAGREGLLDGPAVFIVTGNVGFEAISSGLMHWVGEACRYAGLDSNSAECVREVMEKHLREWLVIRRVEVHYIHTSKLAAIIRRCVEAAQAVIFAPCEPGRLPSEWETKVRIRKQQSWNIRLVLDGLAGLKQAHPNIVNDPLFLSAIRFHCNREGLTAAVVATQSGRPAAEGVDEFERETINTFLQQVRTWRVQFFGEQRVAVAYLPPGGHEGSARIREMLLGADGKVEINPHFELYRGIDQGQPEPVALEIRLVGDDDIKQRYYESLNELFADIFPSINRGDRQVVRIGPGWQRIEYLRDFGRLHRDSRLHHTLVIQIDEHWAFQRSDALRRQENYLATACRNDVGGHDDDPMEIFQPTLNDPSGVNRFTREDGFVWQGHRKSPSEELQQEESGVVDRVPFMWDFGFMLCNRIAWEKAHKQKLHCAMRSYKEDWRDKYVEVGDVWGALSRLLHHRAKAKERRAAEPALEKRLPAGVQSRLGSWRFFLEAAGATSTLQSLGRADVSPAFDLTIGRGESLICLILEMWASEVYRKFSAQHEPDLMRHFFQSVTRRSWTPSNTKGLIGLIAEPETRGSLKKVFGRALAEGKLPDLSRHSLELFKVLLLLREGLDLSGFIDPKEPFQLWTRPVKDESVASRHWYASACKFLDTSKNAEQFVPVRLPGNFSVRGDWFLAVARGSHSSLLADRALDLLSSRRGNFERLRAGIGLPVRDIADQELGADPRTRLTMVDANGRKDWIRYRALASLGAPLDQDKYEPESFHWLWRSTLGDYDAQSRAFLQGVGTFVNWWNSLKNVRDTDWRNGFELYDAIERYSNAKEERDRRRIFDENFAVHSLWEFPELCDDIVDRLKRATPRREKSGGW